MKDVILKEVKDKEVQRKLIEEYKTHEQAYTELSYYARVATLFILNIAENQEFNPEDFNNIMHLAIRIGLVVPPERVM